MSCFFRSFFFFFSFLSLSLSLSPSAITTGRALRRLSMRTGCMDARYTQHRKRILWPEGSSRLSNYPARKKEEADGQNVCYWPCLVRGSFVSFVSSIFFPLFRLSPFPLSSSSSSSSTETVRQRRFHQKRRSPRSFAQFAIRSFCNF